MVCLHTFFCQNRKVTAAMTQSKLYRVVQFLIVMNRVKVIIDKQL